VYSALLTAGLLTLPALAAPQNDTETVNRTVPFPDKGTLKLTNFSGRISITGTTGRDAVIKAVRRADRDRLDHIKLDIRTEGSMVVIDANKRDNGWTDRQDNVVDTEFDIEVPASAMLQVEAFSSRLEIRGVAGDQRLKTFSGDITVTGAKGAMNLDTFSGDLDVDASGAGTEPDLRAKTFSGDIRVKLAADAKGDVSFSGRGAFDSDVPLMMHSSERRGRVTGSLPGGAGGHGLSFDTFSGHVHVVK